jgi:hypothetical protein
MIASTSIGTKHNLVPPSRFVPQGFSIQLLGKSGSSLLLKTRVVFNSRIHARPTLEP